MQFVRPKRKLEVRDFGDDSSRERRCKRRHGDLLPNTIRCIVCGPSNCGKTNALIALLTHANGLRFANVYVYSKSLQQPKYQLLEKCVARVKGMGYFAYSENADIVKPQRAKPHSVFIFDDVACDKQDCMREYFSMGRHNNVDVFYLCQTYARIPKHLIRDNANLLVLFKQDDMNLRHVYDDHVNTDMPFDKFREFCGECWKDRYGFVVIDKDSDGDGRYRCGFDRFFKWQQSTI